MSKFHNIISVLEERIRRGDYALKPLPSERELGIEMGVSRMTARKALKALVERGFLAPSSKTPRSGKAAPKCFAVLMPPFVSPDNQHWYGYIEAVAQSYGVQVRPVFFLDWNDALLADVMRGFDGIFLLTPGMDDVFQGVEQLRDCATPVVSIEQDLTQWGIPSISLFPAQYLHAMLDHLYALGHRDLICFNTVRLPNRIIERRIDDCREWCHQHRVRYTLQSYATPPGCPQAQHAFDVLDALLKDQGVQATAILATTVWMALGAMRAIEANGLTVGQEISVCTINDERLAPWLKPTLTCIQMGEPGALIARCLEWMIQGGPWVGSKLLTLRETPLMIGESTGPVLARKV